MFQVKRFRLIVCCSFVFSGTYISVRAQENCPDEVYVTDSIAENLTTTWTLQQCIDYALQHNISLRKERVAAQSTAIDQLTAKAALFPSLSFSTSQNVVNRPYQESSNYVSGGEILKSDNKTSYNGNYGLNAQWTVYNGSKRLKTIEQEKLNTQAAQLDVASAENNIEETLLQVYVQIMYAAESVKVNEGTLAVSQAQYQRGKELLAAGSLSKVDVAQLEAQVSSDSYQLVIAQTTLENYKLQLKQLLEIEGNEEMNIQMEMVDKSDVLLPLPSKEEVYRTALALRPEIESGKLTIQSSTLNIDIAKAGYLPSVSLTAGIGTNNTSGSDFTFAEQMKNGWNNSAGITVSVPIFNNRQTKSAVQKAKLQHETSVLNLQDEEKNLYKTIEGFWLDANSAQQRYVAAENKQNSATTSFELVSEQFSLGMKNIVDLLTEKNNLSSARQETLQAKYMALLNIQLLRFYQGESIEL